MKDEQPEPRFVTVLRWLVNHPDAGSGTVEGLAARSGIPVDTLARWVNGSFPTVRTSRGVKDLDAWATRTLPDYPPDRVGLVQLSGKHRIRDAPSPSSSAVPSLSASVPPLSASVPPVASHEAPARERDAAMSGESDRGAREPHGLPRLSWRSRRPVMVTVVAAVLVVVAGLIVFLLHRSRADPPQTDRARYVVELSDNKKGVVVFGDPRAAPVPTGVPDRIPYGTAVDVECVTPDESNIPSVSALYKIATGQWKGLYAVSDSFTNGVALGDSGGAAVDPLIPACP